MKYSFTRYLEAKQGIDDRSLNRHVWHALVQRLGKIKSSPDKPIRILEVGAGIGTMIERMLDAKLLNSAIYTAIDMSEKNKIRAYERMQAWAAGHDMRFGESSGGNWDLVGVNNRMEIRFKNEDFFDFASRKMGRFDLIIANAFLDLVDIRATLPLMSELLEKGGLFYFTINFDGLTVLEPAIDEEIDDLILNLYHKTMDKRLVNGKLSGDSRAGRHLFSCLKEAERLILWESVAEPGLPPWCSPAGCSKHIPDRERRNHQSDTENDTTEKSRRPKKLWASASSQSLQGAHLAGQECQINIARSYFPNLQFYCFWITINVIDLPGVQSRFCERTVVSRDRYTASI